MTWPRKEPLATSAQEGPLATWRQERQAPTQEPPAVVPPAEPAPKRDSPEMPTSFGRYRVRRVLGTGGYGAVYLGQDTQLDRPVAIKVLRTEFANTSEMKERFKKEIKLVILVEGDEALLNYISLIPVNPKKFPRVNHADTMTFVKWLTDPAKGQKLIADFGKDKYGAPLFFANSREWQAAQKKTK